MKRHELIRSDFPSGSDGFDRDSVGAHLAAVAAHVAALEARIAALEVERDALRRQLTDPDRFAGTTSGQGEPEPVFTPTHPPETPPAPVHVFADEDEVAARLAVSKLALEGADRETIRAALESGYELEDTDALLDDVLQRLS